MTVAVPAPGQVLRWLGGNLDVRVEIDLGAGGGLVGLWDEGLWDEALWGGPDADYVDITAYVLSVEINGGAERWGERFQAGTCSILVDNTEGYFTPGSTATPPPDWFRDYRLGRLVRVVCRPDPEDPTVREPLFTGRLDASMDGYVFGGFDITAVLSCVDYMGDWAQFNPLAGAGTGVQATDARVESALDAYGWEGDRDVQTGINTMTSSDLAQTTLEEMQRASDAEGGAFFASKDGVPTFKANNWLLTDTRSTVIQGYVGYDTVPTGEQGAHMVDVQVSWEMARTFNDVQFAREGGSLQQATDVPSQAKYGKRTYQRTDFHNNTDAEVLALAVAYVTAFAESKMRIDSVTIVGVEDVDNEDLNRLLWATEFGDRLSVLVTPPFGWEIERETHVMGMSHSITASDWAVTFRLDDAQATELTYWELGDGEFGVLDQTTRLL